MLPKEVLIGAQGTRGVALALANFYREVENQYDV